MPERLICATIAHCLVIFGLALILPFSVVSAQTMACPEVSVNTEKIGADTQDSLTELESRFVNYSIEINLIDERNSILIDFPFADQKLFIDVFYSKYCNLIRNSKITSSEKQVKLEAAQNKLYQRVPFANIVADTRTKNQSTLSPCFRVVRFASFAVESPSSNLLTHRNSSPHFITSPLLFAQTQNTRDDQTDYIRESPFVVTKANKHFVMVASAPSHDTAINEMKRLKRKAPQYDFVVYAPYGSNPNYSIMMATWVPYALAKRVLILAKRDVNPGSIIWSCRHEGNYC